MLIKFLRSKPHVKNMNIIFYDIYYTVIKNRAEKQIVNDECENDYNSFNDFITPNHNLSTNPRETILK